MSTLRQYELIYIVSPSATDETVAELKRRGADIAVEPRTIRPGVRIAFVRAPDDVRIELLQRD